MTKSNRTVPAALRRSGGSVPSQNRACSSLELALPLNEVRQHNDDVLFLSPSQTNEGTAAPGCAVLGVLLPVQQRVLLALQPRLSLPEWAAGKSWWVQALARTRLSGYAQLAFQFARSGALVCPVSGSQHSEQSSGLALGGWVMASAGRINICAIVGAVLWFWIGGGG